MESGAAMRNTLLLTLAGLALGLLVSQADGFPCLHCRGAGPCQKTARLVCEEQEVEITCWGCQCEDFALPGPSRPGCKHCDTVCQDCAQQPSADGKRPGVFHLPQPFVWRDWFPNPQARVFTKKKLMKKVVKQKIPSYKWVVEDLCADCAAERPSATAPAGSAIPQPPPGARILPPRTALAPAPVAQ